MVDVDFNCVCTQKSANAALEGINYVPRARRGAERGRRRR